MNKVSIEETNKLIRRAERAGRRVTMAECRMVWEFAYQSPMIPDSCWEALRETVEELGRKTVREIIEFIRNEKIIEAWIA